MNKSMGDALAEMQYQELIGYTLENLLKCLKELKELRINDVARK